jgi:hypothetical protein
MIIHFIQGLYHNNIFGQRRSIFKFSLNDDGHVIFPAKTTIDLLEIACEGLLRNFLLTSAGLSVNRP